MKYRLFESDELVTKEPILDIQLRAVHRNDEVEILVKRPDTDSEWYRVALFTPLGNLAICPGVPADYGLNVDKKGHIKIIGYF